MRRGRRRVLPSKSFATSTGWYVQALVRNEDPFKKGRARLRQYATAQLIREIDGIRKGPGGLDGDPFVDAQDFDREWATDVTVAPPVVRGDRTTTNVELKSREMGTRGLQTALVQSDGVWKVDKVRQ